MKSETAIKRQLRLLKHVREEGVPSEYFTRILLVDSVLDWVLEKNDMTPMQTLIAMRAATEAGRAALSEGVTHAT